MADAFLKQIDWLQPWLAPVRPVAERVLQASSWRDGLNAAARSQDLKNHQGCPLKFVPQSDLPAGMAYETFIGNTGNVPTRDNLHDFFNALVWLTYPQIKVQLNALQATEIARRTTSLQPSRGKLRDAATIFDENAALLLTSDPTLPDKLRRHQWRTLFIEQRDTFKSCCRVHLFGHALMEKLVAPYKGITGHTWVVQADEQVLSLPQAEMQNWLDAMVAQEIKDGLSTSDFTHLPMLGVPGWWPIQDENFYADTAVFRPMKRLTADPDK